MTYAPVVPSGGYAGWRFLTRTLDAQKAAFAKTAATARDEAYFREKIGSVKTSADLLGDRRLLSVALGAFGLGDDIGNRAFLRKVLDDGTLGSDALSNKLADKRYLAFSKAFGFGDFDTPRTQLSDFADEILGKFRTQSFEAAVGRTDSDMRVALTAQRDLADIVAKDQSADSRWYAVMGSTALRKAFQSALGLPTSFAAVDIDQQLKALRSRSEATFGSGEVAAFGDVAKVEKLIRLYFVRSGAAATASSGASAALSLLQAAGMR